MLCDNNPSYCTGKTVAVGKVTELPAAATTSTILA